MTDPHRHRAGFQALYVLRVVLIVFDGAPRSGKTTQFERLQNAQQAPADGCPIFAGAPLFLPAAHDTWRRSAQAAAALAAGRTVFADGWDRNVSLQPDLLLLFGRTVDGSTPEWTWPVLSAERIVPLPEGDEDIVGLAIWTALASRRVYATCPCIVTAAS